MLLYSYFINIEYTQNCELSLHFFVSCSEGVADISDVILTNNYWEETVITPIVSQLTLFSAYNNR